MQKSLYEAISELQKKPSFTTISALKEFLLELSLNLEVEISSHSVWSFIWNLNDDSFSGVADLCLKPQLFENFGNIFEPSCSGTFCVQDPSICKDIITKKNLDCRGIEKIAKLEKTRGNPHPL